MTVKTLIDQVPPTQRAIVIPDGLELNFKQLRSLIQSLRKELFATEGLGAQQVVSIALPNSLEFVASFLAITGSGMIAAPLNPNFKQSEFEFYIDDMKSRLVIVPAGSSNDHPAVAAATKMGAAIAEVHFDGTSIRLNKLSPGSRPPIPGLQRARNPKLTDIAFVLHTSGTTGRPKAVPLLHSNMIASVRNIVGTYKLTEADTSYLVMPLFHVHGLVAGLLSPLCSGGSVIIPPKFSAHHFWAQFQKYGATWYTAVPTIHQIVLKHPIPTDPKPKIRFIRSCSSPLPPSTFTELEHKLGAPVLEAYAMTEACHQMTSNSLPPDVRKKGTVGIGHGVVVVILDSEDNVLPPNTIGEISARGPNVTPGYLNNTKANEESFTKTSHYFLTGDQGFIDNDGMLKITGRIKELINRGGEKISPIELDDILSNHPGVAEAVTFGAPDKLYGQQVNAAVVPRDGNSVTEKELQNFMKLHVAKFKVPTKIFFTDVMPKTATGKIQRRLVAQKFLKPESKL